jgi:outer membrane lipoprotein-sorting protein
MRRLLTASTRHILALLAAVVVLAAGAAVARAALGGASAPPAKPLDRAVYDALRAPAVSGISARIHFTNNLLPSGSLPEGASSPVVTGADGRLWLGSHGEVRLELQSDGGDAQIVADGRRFMLYDASSNTAYTGTLPGERTSTQHENKPTLPGVDRALAHLGQMWTLSGANPGTTADRPSYTVRIAPKDDGGLLGAAELAWDAARGVPLRAAIYAQGQATPVLELAATHVSYGSIPASRFAVRPPAGAKVTTISAPAGHAAGGAQRSADVTGAAAVAKVVGFPLAAPKRLAGLPLKQVRLVRSPDGAGALSVYGQGLGAILVLQSKAAGNNAAGKANPLGTLRLPRIALGDATGSELATALGTVLTFQRNGVSYVVAGSVPPLAAENAARGLR